MLHITKQLFQSIGFVKRVDMGSDDRGFNGKATLYFANQAEARQALTDFNGRVLDGRAMRIHLANPAPVVQTRLSIVRPMRRYVDLDDPHQIQRSKQRIYIKPRQEKRESVDLDRELDEYMQKRNAEQMSID